MKQTAVEFLESQYKFHGELKKTDFEQANEMFEEQDKNKYSEEEVEKIVRAAYTFGEKEFKHFGAFKEWFEQFKKK